MTELTRMLDQLLVDTEWQRLPVIMDDWAKKKYLSQCLERGLET